MQTELTQRSTAHVGEAISHELGAQMVKDYQSANPADTTNYLIGRNIIDQILAQPGCVGIRFYNAYNEIGAKTLVYVGVDETGKAIIEYTFVNEEGNLDCKKAIVADRVKTGGGGVPESDDSGFSWDDLFSLFF